MNFPHKESTPTIVNRTSASMFPTPATNTKNPPPSPNYPTGAIIIASATKASFFPDSSTNNKTTGLTAQSKLSLICIPKGKE